MAEGMAAGAVGTGAGASDVAVVGVCGAAGIVATIEVGGVPTRASDEDVAQCSYGGRT